LPAACPTLLRQDCIASSPLSACLIDRRTRVARGWPRPRDKEDRIFTSAQISYL
jgi:hypothetical protein